MPFNATDPGSVDAAEKAGLDKSREISEALIRLLKRELDALYANRPELKPKPEQDELTDSTPGFKASPGEYPSDIDPNITNEQHDLYKRLSAEYEQSGAAPDVAKAAAFDHAIIGQGADESKNIAKAHEQITDSSLDNEAFTNTASAQNGSEPLSFMQTMTACGVDASVAMAINQLHNQACQHARNVMANQYDSLDKTAEDDLSTAISSQVDDPVLSNALIERHNADVRDIFIGVPKGEFQPELTAENHSERLVGLGLSNRDAERLTIVRDQEIFDAIALATNYPQNGESGSGDLFRAAVEDSLLDKDAKEAIVYNFDEDLATAREQSIYEANEKAARMQRFAEYKSQSTNLTGAAKQALSQGEAISTVYSMVLEDPSSDNTIEQATQVLEEAQNELKALVKESEAVSPLTLAPDVSDSSTTRQDITASYEATLKDAGATDQTAQKAAQDLSAGKGAEHSPSVRQAHREVLAHGHLREMYERVYGSLNVPPSVAQPAAKDAARGLGANHSQNIAMAHSLARVSKTVAPNLDTHDLTQYVNQFRSEIAAKYPGDNTEPTAHTLLKGAAMVALENGEPKENVISMVEKSPLNNPSGGNKADQAKGIVANVSQVMQAKAKRKVQVQDKPVSKAKGKSKKAGIEM
jgi:hypothetical protein